MIEKQIENFFNINENNQGVQRELAKGINATIFPGEKAMLSIVRIEANAGGKSHSHPQEQWGFLLEGSIKRTQGNTTFDAKKGDFWITPGGVEHSVLGGPDGAIILDFFAPSRSEYLKSGRGFGEVT